MAQTLEDLDVQDRIVDKIKSGVHPDIAARACGISINAFKMWMQRGSESEIGKYADFYLKVSQADAELHEISVGRLVEAAKTDWKANEVFMQRRFREHWGKDSKTTIKIGADQDDLARSVISQLGEPGAREKIAELYKYLSAGDQTNNVIEGEFRELPAEDSD